MQFQTKKKSAAAIYMCESLLIILLATETEKHLAGKTMLVFCIRVFIYNSMKRKLGMEEALG